MRFTTQLVSASSKSRHCRRSLRQRWKRGRSANWRTSKGIDCCGPGICESAIPGSMLGPKVKMDGSAIEIQKEEIMKPLVALSLSIGILAAFATWLSLTVGLLVWAIFLAWASFYHCGGNLKSLKTSIINNLFGGICGWAAALLIVVVPTPGLVLRAALFVGLTVIVLVLAAHIK